MRLSITITLLRSIVLLPVLLGFALLLGSCQSAPYTKADDAAVDMGGANASLTKLRAAARDTFACFEPILTPDADLKAQFKSLKASIDRYQAAIQGVRSSIASVEKSTNTYIATYVKVREQVKSSDLRAAMLMRKESIESQVHDMNLQFATLLAASETLSGQLADLNLFLSASLNAQAVSQSAIMGDAIRGAVANLEASADRVSLELKDLAASLASERPNN